MQRDGHSKARPKHDLDVENAEENHSEVVTGDDFVHAENDELSVLISSHDPTEVAHPASVDSGVALSLGAVFLAAAHHIPTDDASVLGLDSETAALMEESLLPWQEFTPGEDFGKVYAAEDI